MASSDDDRESLLSNARRRVDAAAEVLRGAREVLATSRIVAADAEVTIERSRTIDVASPKP